MDLRSVYSGISLLLGTKRIVLTSEVSIFKGRIIFIIHLTHTNSLGWAQEVDATGFPKHM